MRFDLHIGIDYSGAQTPTSRLAGLQVYAATTGLPERVVTPAAPESNHWNWTRQEISEWLIAQARSGRRFIAGIDHGFSFPLSYFQQYRLTSWTGFLEDFVQHWPTHEPQTYVDFIRDREQGPDRTGSSTDFRLTERWTSSTKSVFDFGGPGKVAHSTHAGLPWLLCIGQEVGDHVHFWPFDGWQVPNEMCVIAEAYPSIFKKRYHPSVGQTSHQQDACAIARWLKEMDERAFLERYFDPPLTGEEQRVADLEGWILGIM